MLRRSKTDDEGPIDPQGAPLLVVSDDEGVRITLVRLFEGRGFEASAVIGHDQALSHLTDAAGSVAAVVVDLRDGGTAQALELLDEIRAHDDAEVARTRTLITTDLDESRKFSWQSGVDGYLVRPFHVDELVAAVTESLGRSGDERRAHRDEQAQRSGDAARRAAGGPG